ncbi:MAG: hypothetical protein AAF639_03315 [Chloroflexota bacterium]
MTESITLSPTLAGELREKATNLRISLNTFVEKLIRQSLRTFEVKKQITQEAQMKDELSGVQISSLPQSQNGSHQPLASINETDRIFPSEEEDDEMTMEEIIARIKSRPKNTGAFHPATKSLDEVLAIRKAREADPSFEPGFTPEEWDIYWLPWHQAMKRQEKATYLSTDSIQERAQ